MIKKLFSKKTRVEEKAASVEAETDSLPVNALEQALEQHQMGNLAQAEALYRQILQQNPNHVDALHFLGILTYQTGHYETAVDLMKKALQIEPNAAAIYCNLGLALQASGQLNEAVHSYQQALALQSNNIEAHFNLANLCYAQGQFDAAITHYQQVILSNPGFAAAHVNLGLSLQAQGQADAALNSFEQAIAIQPNYVDAYIHKGNNLVTQNKLVEAIACYRQILLLQPEQSQVYNSLGWLLKQQGQLQEAAENFQRFTVLKPQDASGYYNLGVVLHEQKNFTAAIANLQQAIVLNPNYTQAYQTLVMALKEQNTLDVAVENMQRAAKFPDEALVFNNLGMAFQEKGELNTALKCYQQALAANSDHAEAHYNIGGIYYFRKNLDAAIYHCERAISLNPQNAVAYYSLGTILYALRKLDLALKNYQKALELKPDFVNAYFWLFITRLHCCDWTNYVANLETITTEARNAQPDYDPFDFVTISDDAEAQYRCACTYAVNNYPLAKNILAPTKPYQHDKIRIAYLSADFHNHATAYLMAELFELHDKQRFEFTAVSFGHQTGGDMRKRLKHAFDHFIDVQNKSDADVAQLLRNLEIDIAVDLKGYTQESRPGILSYRPAPVQISYLGYPGTMGCDYIDYIIADRHVIPSQHQPFYSEKVVYLPDCYQVNDSKRSIADAVPSRAELHLPENGFIFCCFNNNYKITPDVFDTWMRLLAKVPGSVLWLLEDNRIASSHLKKAAQLRGIAAERLIFAPRVPLDAHLARQKIADLFLDTLPCNAHTTTSDALWAGLPVITCMGNAFVARVAGSLLHAVGLPELVTENLQDYEALALKLATNPVMLAGIKAKLAQNRSTSPLFDTRRFCRHIEAAYSTMWERYQRGEVPISFAVEAIK